MVHMLMTSFLTIQLLFNLMYSILLESIASITGVGRQSFKTWAIFAVNIFY